MRDGVETGKKTGRRKISRDTVSSKCVSDNSRLNQIATAITHTMCDPH